MRVSGFTFVRNAVRLAYPVVPSLRSLLPLVDELVVNVGDSDDGTLDLIRSLDDPRLRVVESVWDQALKRDGAILAQQTDIALAACTGDVGLYLQADEVLHEEDHPAIRRALQRLADDRRVEGLLFDWLHFYGSFHTVATARMWYRREVRAVRLGVGVRSWRDAQGFRLGPDPVARKLAVVPAGARVFHYGWVRPPAAQQARTADFQRWYHGDEAARRAAAAAQPFAYDPSARVRRFEGTHPAPMRELVAQADWSFEPRPRPAVRLDHLRHDLLDLVESMTGVRLGEYRNYRLL